VSSSERTAAGELGLRGPYISENLLAPGDIKLAKDNPKNSRDVRILITRLLAATNETATIAILQLSSSTEKRGVYRFLCVRSVAGSRIECSHCIILAAPPTGFAPAVVKIREERSPA
jgi:hypothetical protein